MIFHKKNYIWILCLFLIGCAQVKHYSPNQTNRQYSLQNFSITNCSVKINNFRTNVESYDNLGQIIRQQILSSFAGKNTKEIYVISVDIIEHKAFFTLGNWNGETLLRVKVSTQSGNDIAFFDSVGRASLSNFWGYESAKDASQNAYNLAMSDLMSKLSHIRTE